MANAKPAQQGSKPQPQQQDQSTPAPIQQQGSQPIFRDWAAI
jgi:hypothetical protein